MVQSAQFSEKMSRTFRALIALLIIAAPVDLRASSEIIVIKSSDIIPYQKAIEGFKNNFPQGAYREYVIDEDVKDKGKLVLQNALEHGGDLLVAVGPEAAYLAGTASISVPVIFTMVSNPEKIFPEGDAAYRGVSLNLPLSLQLEQIKATFVGRKKVGVLYTPEHNQKTLASMMQQASALGLSVAGMPITSQKEIPEVLEASLAIIDVLLLIPDRTIGSEKILKYLIKSMLLKKIPVVGFNEWFAENGAILSISLDYEEIGKQTAEYARKLLEEKSPPGSFVQEPSRVRTIINLKVAQKLSVDIAAEMLKRASEVIQ
jgi:putative ABC transport system substrate-binding protein